MQTQKNQGTTIPQVSWRTIPIGEEWSSMFQSFKQSAYRLETLQAYAEAGESGPFNQYLKGVLPPPNWTQEWCDMTRSHIDAGRTMRRVHIVDLPLSNYMKFEIECGYVYNDKAGEAVRLLDRKKLSPELLKITQEDFWFFDNSTVMVNDYDKTGALYQARITTDPKAVAYYSNVDRQIWDLSVPFKDFYKTHLGIQL